MTHRNAFRFPSPLISRVGDWRAGIDQLATEPRFQPPPRRTQHAVFPHYALVFVSPQGLWDLSCRSDFRSGPYNSVAVKTYGPPRLQAVLSRAALDQSAATYPALGTKPRAKMEIRAFRSS